VPRHGVLDGAEWFDAPFFGYTPRDALMTDPQQRLFLECSWQALEDAGRDPFGYPGVVGVYAAASTNGYLAAIRSRPGLFPALDHNQLWLANGPDFVATRTSYKLGLTGPSVTVLTACSSSLVAVHQAVQALLNGECDLALAGGATVFVPWCGYTYREGGVLSPDGRCRAFDAAANGTVPGDAVAVVVLKRLADALADGDTIRAVVRGSAVNNDGNDRAGFSAPSVSGQAEVIRTAHQLAGVDPATITYVEAHGTGTPLATRSRSRR
jgi:phthiocerol/phenolphthiocerol synthesis type-I polyketide synthase E